MIVTVRVAGELLSGVVGAGVGGVVWVILLLARNNCKMTTLFPVNLPERNIEFLQNLQLLLCKIYPTAFKLYFVWVQHSLGKTVISLELVDCER